MLSSRLAARLAGRGRLALALWLVAACSSPDRVPRPAVRWRVRRPFGEPRRRRGPTSTAPWPSWRRSTRSRSTRSTATTFVAELDALKQSLDGMTADQAMVGLMRLWARLSVERDGHQFAFLAEGRDEPVLPHARL